MGLICLEYPDTLRQNYFALADDDLIAQGLDFAWFASNPTVDHAFGRGGEQAGTGITRAGRDTGPECVFASGTSTGKFQFNSVPNEGNEVTYFWIGRQAYNATVTTPRTVSSYNGSGSGRYDVYTDSAPRVNFQCLRATTNGLWYATTTGDWVSSINKSFAVAYDGSSTSNNPQMYVNGASVAVTTATAPSGALVSANNKIAVGGRPDVTTRQMQGGLAVVLRLSRRLLASEIQQLHARFFRPGE